MARHIYTLCFLSLLSVISFGISRGECPTGCTCSATEITCDGLDSLPSSDDLFSTAKATVESVSITGSPQITEIPDDYFVDLPELASVSLTSNGLTSLSVNSFKYLPKLSLIDLTGNEIACEEPVHWVKEWLAAKGTNVIRGSCSDDTVPFQGVTEISGFTDFIDDVVPEMLTFPSDQVIEIDEGVGSTTVTVSRREDTQALNTKVVVMLDEGTMSGDVEVTPADLVFPQGSMDADINIAVTDNDDRDPRGFTITVFAESILVGQTMGTFSITDNEPPTTEAPPPMSTTVVTTKPPSDESAGGGSTGKPGEMSSPPPPPHMKSTPKPAGTEKPSDPEPQSSGSIVWVIIIIVIILVVVIVIVVFVVKRMQDRKRTASKEPKAGYAPVKPEGEAKVYNPTTEELA